MMWELRREVVICAVCVLSKVWYRRGCFGGPPRFKPGYGYAPPTSQEGQEPTGQTIEVPQIRFDANEKLQD